MYTYMHANTFYESSLKEREQMYLHGPGHYNPTGMAQKPLILGKYLGEANKGLSITILARVAILHFAQKQIYSDKVTTALL